MNNQDAIDKQRQLIQSFIRTLERENPPVQLFETHLSWVLVTLQFSYKFKKAVRFDFVDFSTLDARRFYCHEELRLNRRLAPDLYLDVIGITGDVMHPGIGTTGDAIEYAVRMHTFSQQSLWTYRIMMRLIRATEIDALAEKIARFHGDAEIAPIGRAWGTPDLLKTIADDNLGVLTAMAEGTGSMPSIDALRSWQALQHQKYRRTFEGRKADGYIRECHGDLHSGNILTIKEQVEVFDCIEFNEDFRWIDVMSDVAFIYMELRVHDRHDLAARFINLYLERTGDYEGLAVLRYYEIQRAMVRCKVALLRARQLRAEAQDAASHENEANRYLNFSVRATKPWPPAMIIMYGLSGSGKSTFSHCLVELIGAVRIRSDVERKRMQGLTAASRAAALPGAGLYDAEKTEAVYRRLHALARHVVESGMPVIVDAAFLKQEQRSLFACLARDLGAAFVICDIHASEETMKKRILARAALGKDPSDAGLQVLAYQIRHRDPLSEQEKAHVIEIHSEQALDKEAVRRSIASALPESSDTPVPGGPVRNEAGHG